MLRYHKSILRCFCIGIYLKNVRSTFYVVLITVRYFGKYPYLDTLSQTEHTHFYCFQSSLAFAIPSNIPNHWLPLRAAVLGEPGSGEAGTWATEPSTPACAFWGIHTWEPFNGEIRDIAMSPQADFRSARSFTHTEDATVRRMPQFAVANLYLRAELP